MSELRLTCLLSHTGIILRAWSLTFYPPPIYRSIYLWGDPHRVNTLASSCFCCSSCRCHWSERNQKICKRCAVKWSDADDQADSALPCVCARRKCWLCPFLAFWLCTWDTTISSGVACFLQLCWQTQSHAWVSGELCFHNSEGSSWLSSNIWNTFCFSTWSESLYFQPFFLLLKRIIKQ